ncbi:MAG: pyridoxal phosphate-dependent aminotransferase [Acidobacteriota bacterium]
MFADRLQRLGTENAFKLADHIGRVEAGGRDVVRLNLGEPDFDAPTHIAAVGMEQIAAGNGHYGHPSGTPGLRRAIARQVSETRGLDIDWRRVVVHPGGKPSIAYSLLSYVNPGDEVIYPSPGFPVYESWITFLGAKPVPLKLRESAGFAVTADDLAALTGDRTRLIILNSPSNPTGSFIDAAQLAATAQVIADRAPADARIYSDEIYEKIIFDGLTHQSIASQPGMAERTVIASGHSKTFAMTGWRLGYSVLPSREEAEVFKNLNINLISCVPPFVQEAGREALESPESETAVQKMVSAFDERRKIVVEGLNAIEGVSCVMPRGAFYVFPNVSGACQSLGAIEAFERLSPQQRARSSPSTLLQMFALYRHGVATMDRPSFCRIGSEGEHYLRLSTAADIDKLREGVARLAAATEDSAGFVEFVAEGVPGD